MDSTPPAVHPRDDRRDFLKKAGIGGVAAGALWVAPQIVSQDAAHAAASDCTGALGYFTWARTNQYSQGQRGGAPGTNTLLSGAGWGGLPTYDTPNATGGSALGVTANFRLAGSTTYLNADAGGQGYGVSNAGTSAVFKSLRVSKIENNAATPDTPPAGNDLTIIITFSETVGCPRIVLGDIDNNLPTTGSGPGCTSPVAGSSPYWADRVSATANTLADGTGSSVGVSRTTGTGGSNVTPGVGSSGPWSSIACQSVPQNVTSSDLALQVAGPVQRLEISYISGYEDTVGTGAQHMAFGEISFYYP